MVLEIVDALIESQSPLFKRTIDRIEIIQKLSKIQINSALEMNQNPMNQKRTENVYRKQKTLEP